MNNNFITSKLSPADLKTIIDAMYEKVYEEGKVIIQYGLPGTDYHILREGVAEVVIYKDGTTYDDPDIDK